VHRNTVISSNQPDALIIQIYSVIKLYMFRASSLPIISFLLYIRHWFKFHAGFLMTASKQSQDVSSILTLLESGHQKTCTILTSAECAVENSWWWAEKMPETCIVL